MRERVQIFLFIVTGSVYLCLLFGFSVFRLTRSLLGGVVFVLQRQSSSSFIGCAIPERVILLLLPTFHQG